MSTIELDKYIFLEEGMIIIDLHFIVYGKGYVFARDANYFSVVWENGEIYRKLPKDTKWFIFSNVGTVPDKEFLVMKLKYSHLLEG